MTPDEARRLIGGYATGSLTEAERRVLFEAALQDQELFDELAGEQVLKEVLDEPGARQRLIAALEPPGRHRAWLWTTAAATAAIAVVIGIVVSQRTPPPPPQIALVVKSPEPVVTPAAAPATEPPVPPKRKVAPAPAPPPAPPAELKKEEGLADQLQQAKPQATEAARGFVAGAPAAAALRAQNETVTVTTGPVLFSYVVGTDGFLQITTTLAAGFVSVSAEFADRDVVIFPSMEVAPGTRTRIQIPTDATGLIIGFSKTPGVNDASLRRSLVSGFAFDTDPSSGKVRIEVPAKP
jgi:hypothetical protein